MKRPEDLERSIGYVIGDVSRLFKKLFDRRVQDLELTRSQWLVLAYLQRLQGTTQSQLASRLEIEKPTLGRLVDRLEAKGWVERRADVNDRRTNLLYLTESAVPIIETMQDLASQVVADALSGFSDDEVERLTGMLLRMKDNLSVQISPNGAGAGANAGAAKTKHVEEGRDGAAQ